MLDYLRLVYIHKRVNVSSEVEKEQKVLVLYIINGGSLEMDFILYMYMLCSLLFIVLGGGDEEVKTSH